MEDDLLIDNTTILIIIRGVAPLISGTLIGDEPAIKVGLAEEGQQAAETARPTYVLLDCDHDERIKAAFRMNTNAFFSLRIKVV